MCLFPPCLLTCVAGTCVKSGRCGESWLVCGDVEAKLMLMLRLSFCGGCGGGDGAESMRFAVRMWRCDTSRADLQSTVRSAYYATTVIIMGSVCYVLLLPTRDAGYDILRDTSRWRVMNGNVICPAVLLLPPQRLITSLCFCCCVCLCMLAYPVQAELGASKHWLSSSLCVPYAYGIVAAHDMNFSFDTPHCLTFLHVIRIYRFDFHISSGCLIR